ncbi:MAG: thiamine phosphate synthase [Thermoguttaceae bacterium]|nr:thiamine phosphate synthase [Thermoguttaceae bacterium]
MNMLFGDAVERMLIEAAHWADDPFDPQLFLPGLFYGMLIETECRATLLLTAKGLTPDCVHTRWPQLTRHDQRVAGWPELSKPPKVFDDEAVVIRGLAGSLRRAIRNMERRLWDFPRPMMIMSEHLLLALACMDHEVGEFLRELGIEPDALETQIREWYGFQHRPIEGGDGEPLPFFRDEEPEYDSFSENDYPDEKSQIFSILGEFGFVDSGSENAAKNSPLFEVRSSDADGPARRNSSQQISDWDAAIPLDRHARNEKNTNEEEVALRLSQSDDDTTWERTVEIQHNMDETIEFPSQKILKFADSDADDPASAERPQNVDPRSTAPPFHGAVHADPAEHADSAGRSEERSVNGTKNGTDDTTRKGASGGDHNASDSTDAAVQTTPLEICQTPEAMTVLRILDAAGNRAREALRVLEDYARFMLDHPFLTEQLKGMRHQFAAALDRFPLPARLAARETLIDVGTRIETASEQHRGDAASVLTANFCRLQESLRSLEEYAKIFDSDASRTFEQLRYKAYTLQRTVRATGSRTRRLINSRLYLLVSGGASSREFARQMIPLAKSGVDVIQLRDKTLDDRKLMRRARILREITAKYRILFIMNDRPDIALLTDADGVHLGQREMHVSDARRLLGPNRLIGVSTHCIEQAQHAVMSGADYIGVGPVFPSTTKTFDAYPGLDYVRAVAQNIALPAFAIGGITIDNLPQVTGTGMRRVAVASAVTEADDPVAAVTTLREMLSF